MTAAVTDLLINPGRFFEQKMQEKESLTIPFLVVFVLGIISAATAVLSTAPFLAMLPAEAASFTPIVMAISAGAALVASLVMWVVCAVIFFVISMVFSGTGGFKRVLEFVGYGFLPQIIGAAVTLPISYLYFADLTIPQVSDPAQIEEVTRQLLAAPELQIAVVISLLFLIWSANIWIFGMKESRTLSTRNAAITVGVPVGLYVLSQLSGLLFSGGF
ncbi:MAG: Yip1 family protein [Methanomicrobiaceae archaeon]|nr:Yip1 family protein [Methanomicrobiaceae archaeon]